MIHELLDNRRGKRLHETTNHRLGVKLNNYHDRSRGARRKPLMSSRHLHLRPCHRKPAVIQRNRYSNGIAAAGSGGVTLKFSPEVVHHYQRWSHRFPPAAGAATQDVCMDFLRRNAAAAGGDRVICQIPEQLSVPR